jgi:hypothetical protein
MPVAGHRQRNKDPTKIRVEANPKLFKNVLQSQLRGWLRTFNKGKCIPYLHAFPVDIY